MLTKISDSGKHDVNEGETHLAATTQLQERLAGMIVQGCLQLYYEIIRFILRVKTFLYGPKSP